MSIFAEVTDEALTLLKGAGHAIVTFESTEKQKIVNLAKDTHLYTEAENAISNAQSTFKTGTGADKMNWVVNELKQIATDWLTAGGWNGVFLAVEHFLQALVQLVFNDIVANLAKVGAG